MPHSLNTDQWQQVSEHHSQIWFDKQTLTQVSSEWFNSDYWQQQNGITGESKGRYTTYFLLTKDKQAQPLHLVLRHYYRGGMVSKLSKRSFVFTGYNNTRAYQELALLNRMRELGLPVPKPIAARVTKSLPWLCQNDLLIERIAGAQDLFHYLSKQALTDELWQQVGTTIRTFHQQGVYHSDLNIHNILIDEREKIWLIDFDRCDIRAPESQWQQANLARLERSLHKELGLNAQFAFTPACWQQLLKGYQA